MGLKDILLGILNSRIANADVALSTAISSRNLWTPIITGTAAAGVGTYVTQVGNYFRSGPLVYATYRVTTSAHTGTGNAFISNLPFGVASTTNDRAAGSLFSAYQAIAFSLCQPATTQLYFYLANPTTPAPLPAGNGDWLGSIIYLTDDP